MKNPYLKKAKEIIEQRRVFAKRAVQERLESLRSNYPAFKEAESSLDSLYFEKARLESQNEHIGVLDEQITAAEQAYNNELQKLKLTKADLLVKYSCSICQDSGYTSCGKRCSCINREIAKLIAGSRDGRVTKSKDFITDFSVFADKANEYKVNYNLIEKLARDYPDTNTKFLIFSGKAGSGKTYLASILANALEQKLHNLIFIKSTKLNKVFLEYHLAQEKDGIFESVHNCDILIIDDLGSENVLKNVTKEYLYQLVVEREQKLTLITTNFTGYELNKAYGSRIMSRLADKRNAIWLSFNSEDLRLK